MSYNKYKNLIIELTNELTLTQKKHLIDILKLQTGGNNEQ